MAQGDQDIRVLLVDDEQGFLDVLQKRLGRRGFVVTVAPGGREGLQLLRAHEYDVAVLDLKMQDLDGIEVLKMFKVIAPDIPVLMLTGHGSERAAHEGMRHGAFDYLLKPCDFDQLMEKLRAAAAGRGSA